MGTAGAKAFGHMLLVNKTIQTLDVSYNGFEKMQVGDEVKLKSSGEMKVVTEIDLNNLKGSDTFDVFIDDYERSDLIKVKGSDSKIKPSEYEWESQVPAFCTGVAASPSLISVSTIFRHALATSCYLFSLLPSFPPCT